MLVLTRKQQENICIGDEIVITVLRVKGKSVRLGIEAPEKVCVLRGELVFDASADKELASGSGGATGTTRKPALETARKYEKGGHSASRHHSPRAACGVAADECLPLPNTTGRMSADDRFAVERLRGTLCKSQIANRKSAARLANRLPAAQRQRGSGNTSKSLRWANH